MSKTIKISITCPKCTTKFAIPIVQNDLGKQKKTTCPKCHKNILVNIPSSLASKFESDPTCIGNSGNEKFLLIEAIPNTETAYQAFELTSDYYTIGRQNCSGPEYRPDVEVVTTDKKISRKHAVIRKKGNGSFTIKDLSSKNGVLLNNNRLETDEEMYLNDGDIFQIGGSKFRVSIAEQSIDSDDLTQ